jgi:hypothetical protein
VVGFDRHGPRGAQLLAVLVALLAGCLAVPAVAHATTRTFMGPGTDWFIATNWSPNGVPSSSDDVIVDSGSVSIGGAAANARSIAFDTGLSQSGSLTVASGASLTTSSSGSSSIGGFLVVDGTLTLDDPTTFASSANSNGINVSGTVDVGSTLTFDGSDVVHGNINATGVGALIHVVPGGSLVRDTSTATQTIGPKVDDDGTISVTTGTLALAGGDAGTSSGSVAVSTGATLHAAGSTFEAATVSGAGTLDVAGSTATIAPADTFTLATVHLGGNGKLTVDKDLSLAHLISASGTRDGTGTLTITGSADLSGLTLASGATTTVANTVSSVALAHFLQVDGTLTLDTPTTFGGSSDSNGINVSGTVDVGSTLTFDGNDSVHGNINATGVSALIHVLSGGSLIRDTDGGIQTISPVVDNDGSIEVKTGTLAVGGLTQASGTTQVDASAGVTGAVTINGGTLRGAGDLGGPVANAGGTVAPGTSPGILTIDGDYTQSAGATLKADIAGTTVGTGYDRLAVGGTATLDGTLAIVNDPAFDPALSDAFVVLTAAGGRLGQFSALTGATVQGKVYAPHYNANDVTLGTGLAAPANTGPPTIPASGATGTTISCDPGSWTGSPTFAFSWRSDGTPISGATAQQYTLADADAGHTITCHVVASNGAGSTPADSNALVPSLPPPANTTPPSIPATGKPGDKITCDPGSWTHAPTFTFAWTRDGTAISGATGQTYTLTDADAGHVVRCVVTAQDSGGAGAPATSGALAASAPPAAPAPTPVAITQIATLPSAHVCVSRRHFRIHLKGIAGIVQARIQLTGVPARTVKGRALGLPIDLRGLPKGTVVVKITITQKSGRRLAGKRTYHTCVPGKRKRH